MRGRLFVMALLTLLVASLNANAQIGGGGTGGTGGGGTGGIGGGTGGTGGGGTSFSGSTGAQANLVQQAQVPDITVVTTTNTVLSSTNGFAQYYANPLFAGRAGSTGNEAPGGFGQALAGAAGGTGARTGTTTGLRTGTTGLTTGAAGFAGTTGLGGNLGVGGLGAGRTTQLGGVGGQFGGIGGQLGGIGGQFGGLGTTARGARGGLGTVGGVQQGAGVVIPLPSPITYTSTARFPTPSVAPQAVQAELRSVLDRSSLLSNAAGISVTFDGSVVVLQGTVRDAEEAQTAEGLIRLTPGIKQVKNELKY